MADRDVVELGRVQIEEISFSATREKVLDSVLFDLSSMLVLDSTLMGYSAESAWDEARALSLSYVAEEIVKDSTMEDPLKRLKKAYDDLRVPCVEFIHRERQNWNTGEEATLKIREFFHSQIHTVDDELSQFIAGNRNRTNSLMEKAGPAIQKLMLEMSPVLLVSMQAARSVVSEENFKPATEGFGKLIRSTASGIRETIRGALSLQTEFVRVCAERNVFDDLQLPTRQQ